MKASQQNKEVAPDYLIHDIANIFPMMTTAELESLKQDITVNGLREPIYLFQNKIIDGRNRYKACKELGIVPEYREYTGNENELFDFVVSLNLHRRHLNTSQKACLAVELLPILEQKTKQNLSIKMSAIRKGDKANIQGDNSSKTASKIFGVSERYIFESKKLHKESPELFNQVRSGILSLQQAKKQFEVSAKLQNPENKTSNVIEEPKQIELSKRDKIKVSEIVKELGVSEHKAVEYILKHKRIKQPVKSKQAILSEVKFRVTPDAKQMLFEKAKNAGVSVSEYLRGLLM